MRCAICKEREPIVVINRTDVNKNGDKSSQGEPSYFMGKICEICNESIAKARTHGSRAAG